MDTDNDARLDQFYSKLNNRFLEINSIFNECQDINTKWNLGITEIKKLNDDSHTIARKINDFKTKISRKIKKMIVFGETSSGKSAFINALLKRKLLLMKKHKGTNCVIKIKQLPDNEDNEYVMVNDEKKKIDILQNYETFNSLISTERFAYVFIDYKNSDLPFGELEIIETPGINSDDEINDIIKRECSYEDIVILMMNCTSIINSTIEKFSKNLNDAFSKIKVYLIFNRCEEIDNDDDKEEIREKFYNDGEKILNEIFKYTPEIIKNRIYFISSKEQLNNELEGLSEITDATVLKRKDEFISMKSHLKKDLNVSHFERIQTFLEIVLETRSKVEAEIKVIGSDFIKHRDVHNSLNTTDYKENIKKIITELSIKYYEIFVKESIEIKRKNKDDREELEEIFINLCDKLRRGIKGKIKELIQRDDEKYLMEQFHFKLIDEQFGEFKYQFEEDFKRINKIIKVSTGVTIGSIVVLGIACALTVLGLTSLGIGIGATTVTAIILE